MDALGILSTQKKSVKKNIKYVFYNNQINKDVQFIKDTNFFIEQSLQWKPILINLQVKTCTN